MVSPPTEWRVFMEYLRETLARLREQLGREPTAEELKTERDARWRRQLEAMMRTDLMLRDEAESQIQTSEHTDVRETD